MKLRSTVRQAFARLWAALRKPFSRFRKAKQAKSKVPLSVVILPQSIHYFDGAFTMMAPHDMVVQSRQSNELLLVSRSLPLRISIQTLVFSVPIHKLTAEDILEHFDAQFSHMYVQSFQRSYLGHTPTLTIHFRYLQTSYNHARSKSAVFHLIQTKEITYLLTFYERTAQTEPIIDAMLHTIQIKKHRSARH